MRILVSGGAGYIGSHTTLQLIAAGHEAVIVDDFSRSKPRWSHGSRRSPEHRWSGTS